MISDLDTIWTHFLIIFLFWCRYQSIKGLPEVQQVHVQVGLYSFFHLLYGMFPCNFLSYLRVHYSENNRENHAVFIHTIKPMLNHVKMHPSLVTQTKDYEKVPFIYYVITCKAQNLIWLPKFSQKLDFFVKTKELFFNITFDEIFML